MTSTEQAVKSRMENGLHLSTLFYPIGQSALQFPPLIHLFTPTLTPMAVELPCKALACLPGATWGSVSYSRTQEEEPGIKPPTLLLVDNPFYLPRHSHPITYINEDFSLL